MRNGGSDDRLKAAKLQMEAVGRVGARAVASVPTGTDDSRLEKLAERLVGLLRTKQNPLPITVEGEHHVIQES